MADDAVELLLNDHRDVDSLFREFESNDAGERQPVAEKIVKELSIHAAIEETVFYPAVREDVPEGDPLVEHSLDEHHDIKDAAATVDSMMEKAHTKKFEDAMARLKKVVHHHVQEEEREIFPRVREALSQTRLDDLGTAMRKAKKTAPTRPHPAAPDQGAAAEVVGKASGAIDRARDAVTGRGTA